MANSDIIKLLRDTADNFAQLANAFEQEQNRVDSRIVYLENTVCETRQTIKDAASLILTKL
jgi:hypothetical protein